MPIICDPHHLHLHRNSNSYNTPPSNQNGRGGSGLNLSSLLIANVSRWADETFLSSSSSSSSSSSLVDGGGGREAFSNLNQGISLIGTNKLLNSSTTLNSLTTSPCLLPPSTSSSMAAAAAAAAEVSDTTEAGSMDTWTSMSWPITLILCLAYSLVFLIGIIGNSFVVAVVLRLPRMRTTTNFFIVNLAIADLLVIIFCLPFNLIINLSSAWILGEWICKIVPYLQGVSVSASIDTLIAIAIERWLAICHPMKCQISSRNCRLIILIIWTFSLSITLPWAIFFQLTPVGPHNDMLVCTEQWPNAKLGNIYFVVAHLVLCYILPLILITICYALILRRVSMRKIPQETKNLSTELLVHRSKMKVIKMLMRCVILFALSWLPLYAIFTRLKFGPVPSDWEDQLIRTIAPMAQWLGSSNSCINPILYTVYNKKYRCAFKALLTSRSCCKTLRVEVSKTDSSTRSSNRINLSTQMSSTKQRGGEGGGGGVDNGTGSNSSNNICQTASSISMKHESTKR